jgi:hypothetical protein
MLIGGMKFSWSKDLKVQTNLNHHLQSQTTKQYLDPTLNNNVSRRDVGQFENPSVNMTSNHLLAAPSFISFMNQWEVS